MVSYIVKRLLSLIPVLVGISLITFLILRLTPGDPAEAYLRLSQIPPTEAAVAAVRTELGLDRPLPVQYGDWLVKALTLDFGRSYATHRPVWDEMMLLVPATAQLAGVSLLITLIISIPMGIFSALYKDGWFDNFCRLLAFTSASTPNFWLGFLLMYFFSLKLDLLPTLGRGSWEHFILPAVTLSFAYIATYIRLLRTSMLENLDQQFVLYARARGLKESWVIGRHVLKNAMLPVVTALGMSIGHLLSGSVIVESVFAWPGIGRFCVSAILNRDYPVVQCFVLMMSFIFVIANLLVDIAYAWLDPRIRLKEESQ
ncbi:MULTISPECIES: nickel ABC transporter permease subunit NikB [Sporomusa]|jgi:nickel transport system permease protein|uniref:nickel ABC transporter permease subunit NikB n=1 Tax=Sporomusa TaxID=2375 RepID=UPI001662D1E3|nr:MULTISPECIES: nickel ABC transporter permease subunit NikB [Sporomusa]MCM0757514.1 nickel ABC transporter permease subunit NikB [Sporomusa sphaeroides DSM 2875]HML32979.1 nickel ABC transporter permease subunit NikB [Sporomusa sphaeroides]